MDTEEIYVEGGTVIISGSDVTIEYEQQTEYTDNEILMQINDNLCDGFALMSGLIAALIGFLVAKELLKIWLQ